MTEEVVLEDSISTEGNEAFYTQADLDRARTQASKTARENAKKELLTDAQMEAYFRDKFEQEASMSAEQKYHAKLEELEKNQRELDLRANKLLAQQKLVESGLPATDVGKVLDFVTGDTQDSTIEKIENFMGLFNELVDNKVKDKTKEILESSDTPKGEPTKISESTAYKTKYDTAISENTLSSQADAIAILIEAADKGITL